MTHNKNIAKRSNKIIAICIGLLTGFLVAELSAIIWLNFIANEDQKVAYKGLYQVDMSTLRYAPHPYLCFGLAPLYQNGNTYHNSMGFRGAEIERPKPQGVFRIIAMGGSTTYSTGVDKNDEAYPAQLETILKERYEYGNIEVINAGVSDYTSWEHLTNFQFRLLELEPDMLVLNLGINDVGSRLVKPENYKSDHTGNRSKVWYMPIPDWWERSAIIRIIVRRFIGLHGFILDDLVGINNDNLSIKEKVNRLNQNRPIFYKRNLSNLLILAEANNINVLLASFAYTPQLHPMDRAHLKQGVKEHNLILDSLASYYKVPVFDFSSSMPTDISYWSDGMHLNSKGTQLKGSLFAEFIHNNQLIPAE